MLDKSLLEFWSTPAGWGPAAIWEGQELSTMQSACHGETLQLCREEQCCAKRGVYLGP